MKFKNTILSIFSASVLIILTLVPVLISAQNNSVDAKTLLPRISINIMPRNGTFVEGSTFEVSILINSKGNEINGIEVRVGFDKNKLSVVKPSGGQSIIGVWVEPPSFDNTKGVVNYVGVVPNGIKTESGLIGTITFKAKTAGQAVVSIRSNSRILLNDGAGTETVVDLGRAEYSIVPKLPEGVVVFSETHPFPSEWYNNNSPVLSWDKDSGVTGFSYVLDNKPNTIPENKILAEDTTKGYENLTDGLWYFHIKAYKQGIWGNTGHFLIKIDTTPPADFQPEVDYVLAAVTLVERSLVSFFTTDNLSGINRYEVGIINKSEPTTESPVFIQAESPFQVPLSKDSNLKVIVRAIDNAGNIRDAAIDVYRPFTTIKFIRDNIIYILILILLIGAFFSTFYYLISRRMFKKLKNTNNQNTFTNQNNFPNQNTGNRFG